MPRALHDCGDGRRARRICQHAIITDAAKCATYLPDGGVGTRECAANAVARGGTGFRVTAAAKLAPDSGTAPPAQISTDAIARGCTRQWDVRSALAARLDASRFCGAYANRIAAAAHAELEADARKASDPKEPELHERRGARLRWRLTDKSTCGGAAK